MTKRLLLSGAIIAAAVSALSAETKVYTTYDFLGEISSVSANGEYATVYDIENNKAYLWTKADGKFTDISEPKGDKTIPASKRVAGTWAMGVADDGTVVGSVLYDDGKQRPAIYKDGKWDMLPLSPNALNTNTAIAITHDCKVIGGYQYFKHPDPEIPGAYRPCTWTLVDGEYVLNSYEDIEIPKHQGFFPTCMSPDGSVIAGTVYAGVASEIPCYLQDGELNIMATLTLKDEPWIFKDKYYCGTDENGKQIWTDDPNDPRIVLFTETYIDGVKDEGQQNCFNGGFQGVDAKGNLYGNTCKANEESQTFSSAKAAIYNYKTNEWTYDDAYSGFTGGLDGKYVFCAGNTLLIDGEPATFTKTFGFEYPLTLSAFYKTSDNGQVIGGNLYEINPASNEPQFYPIIIVLDEPLVEVNSVDTIGGEGAATEYVYDLNGRFVGHSVSGLAAGVYVVRSGDTTSKVLVK